jgi:hypothetical protein
MITTSAVTTGRRGRHGSDYPVLTSDQEQLVTWELHNYWRAAQLDGEARAAALRDADHPAQVVARAEAIAADSRRLAEGYRARMDVAELVARLVAELPQN